MGVFYVLFFVPIVMQHVVVKQISVIDYDKKNKRALTFFFLIFAALIMLRHESIGSDTKNYGYYFNVFSRLSWEQCAKVSTEIGFSYFNKIISLFTKEPQVFFAVAAIVTVAMIYPTYRRLCLDASLTIVLFCAMSTFVMAFSGIRQMLAIGLGFIAYEFTRNKKWIFFILTVCLAMTFHVSAFMLAFMYPLYHVKITKKWLFAVVPLLVLLFIFNERIFVSLGVLLEQFTEYDASITQTGAFTMLVLFTMFAMFAFLVPEETALDAEAIGLRNLLLLAVALQMFAPLHTIAMRMNYYYIIFIPLLIPKIIAARSKSLAQVAIVSRYVMLGFFLIYFFVSANGEGNLDVFPYRFFWEGI